MTALNLVVQPRAGAAFLLTDTGVYGPDGRIAAFQRKTVEFSIGGRPSAVIATTGPSLAGVFLESYASTLRPATVHELLTAFPQVFREIEQKLAARGVKKGFSALLAIYDHERRRPVGYGMSSCPNWLPNSAIYSLQPVKKYLTDCARLPFDWETDVCDPRQWKPRSDGLVLLDAQRSDPFERSDGNGGYHGVGGEAILTRVDADGVHHEVLKTWPDRIGRRIDPHRKAGWRERLTPPWLRPAWAANAA